MNRFIILLFLVFTLPGCFLNREILVEYDYDYRGQFTKYGSFDFIEDVSTDSYHSNQHMHQGLIQKFIGKRLEYLGYEQKEKNPDIYIAYKVFYSDFQIGGYDQPDLYTWVENPNEDLEKYDKVKYQLKEGTIYVTFLDRKSQQAIWRGYASGIFGNMYFDNSRYVNEAVKRILDNYRFLATADTLYRRYP